MTSMRVTQYQSRTTRNVTFSQQPSSIYKLTFTLHPLGNLVFNNFKSFIHFSSIRSLDTLLPLNIPASTDIRTSGAEWFSKCLKLVCRLYYAHLEGVQLNALLTIFHKNIN